MYKAFQGLAWEMKRVFKENGIPFTKESFEAKMQEILGISVGLKTSESGLLSQEAVLCLFEMVHYLLIHKVIYVPKEFSDKMIQADLRFNLEHIKLPHRLFELCFEDTYRLPSALVFALPDPPIMRAIERFMKHAVATLEAMVNQARSLTGKEPVVLPGIIRGGLENAFSLRYRASDGGICHANIPTENFKGLDVSDVVDGLGDLAETSFGYAVPLNQEEKDTQKDLMRVTMGVLAYFNVEGADIESWKNRNRPSLGIAPTGFLVGSKIRHQSWFIRSGGPVMLRHERYRRDEAGNIRVIWRKAAEVNTWARPAVPVPKVEEVK